MSTNINNKSTVIIESVINYNKILHKNKKTTEYLKFGIGIIVEVYSNKLYCLTCYHIVKNSKEINIHTHDKKKYESRIITSSDELDLALLQLDIDLSVDDNNFLNVKNDIVHHNLSIDDKIIINTYDLDDILGRINKYKFLKLFCKYNDLIFENLHSLNMPKLPYVNISIKDFDKKYMDVSGLSGSPVMANNKFIGLISYLNNNNNTISITPNIIINIFIKQYIKFGKFIGICDIIGRVNCCTLVDENNPSLYGLQMSDTFDINYNLNKAKTGNLRKNDIIIKVDGNEINKDYKLLDPTLKIYINFNTFIALNYSPYDTMILSIIRETNESVEQKDITICNMSLAQFKYIPISDNGKIVTYAGMNFIELSEEIVNSYRDNNINISESISEWYVMNPFRQGEKKIIALINIYKDKLDNEILRKLDKLNIPLLKDNNKYFISILSSITNSINQESKIEKIDNIDNLKDNLNNTPSDGEIVFNITLKNKKIKIITVDGKIVSIE